ncbi:UvrD-helicase domain-containing protein [Pseudobacteriovorax antillogorgiicola]|uniref:DNA helicase-2 / ATP-dependent DNA helicase PcrA n=1 Tax=Pseudobacteriovorax antillogorgiicola TaxID=1513793 RepID=A0A1Y6BC41_9BACT|nr:UvrD-helicase domain-containing protein [Pseudobacteriovorax antillogorgiicola]TCS58688.1 DNA helicase-2/ATP-dependent DNA helicase PcrA [Pseudobacteriovorax antillogorgiicola]SME95815.1 DNA helicase-2 / ATP-dependent DNA helicase PcrA [Pseudobacteriovorax antillogorgiicola]
MEGSGKLSEKDHAIIAEEESLLQQVQDGIKTTIEKRKINMNLIAKRLEALRDEASTAKTADLPALFDQMNTQRALIERSPDDALPERLSPYFAHMQLEEQGRKRDVLLGHITFLDTAKAPVIDWRHAPVSRIFFNYREGEEYEEELPGRLAEGVVTARRIVTVERGELVHIITPERSYTKDDQNNWIVDNRHALPSLMGGAGTASRSTSIGTGQSGSPSPDIAALLDPEQYRLLNSAVDDPLLILGGAGCGKTTVALHRMAYLNYLDKKRFAQNRMIVIVPEPGLVHLSGKLLRSLHLNQVQITTFEQWISQQARQLIKSLPKRVYKWTPGNVIRFKRHPAVRVAFEELVRQQVDELVKTFEKKLPGSDAAAKLLQKRTDLALLERLELAEKEYIQSLPGQDSKSKQQRIAVVKKFFQETRKNLLNVANDRIDLFSNREMLEWIVKHSDGQLSEGMIDQVLSHSLEQFNKSSQQRYSNIDASKLETIDGKSLAEEDADELAGTIDSEDFAVLLELHFFKAGRASTGKGRLKQYTHMVIDEAQDLAPMERNVLGRTLHPDAAITIAGDSAQQIDPSTSFDSWETVLDELGVTRVSANHLTTTYRSSAPIAAFAHKVLGPIAPRTAPTAIKDGAPVSFSNFKNDGQMSLMLNEALTDLILNEPHASVAIIAKEIETAKKLYDVLRDVPKVRFVPDGDFEFRPGIEITDASQVKGLEFDYVIVPDASYNVYRDKPEDRRLLHVAATRAIHQLWVISQVKPSPIIEGDEFHDQPASAPG